MRRTQFTRSIHRLGVALLIFGVVLVPSLPPDHHIVCLLEAFGRADVGPEPVDVDPTDGEPTPPAEGDASTSSPADEDCSDWAHPLRLRSSHAYLRSLRVRARFSRMALLRLHSPCLDGLPTGLDSAGALSTGGDSSRLVLRSFGATFGPQSILRPLLQRWAC